jgi:hypothetical protein
MKNALLMVVGLLVGIEMAGLTHSKGGVGFLLFIVGCYVGGVAGENPLFFLWLKSVAILGMVLAWGVNEWAFVCGATWVAAIISWEDEDRTRRNKKQREA